MEFQQVRVGSWYGKRPGRDIVQADPKTLLLDRKEFTKGKRALGKSGLKGTSPIPSSSQVGKVDENTTYSDADIRSRNPRFTPEAIKANRAVVDLLERIGTRLGASPAQIALAWLLAQKPWIFPIPGSRKLGRLEENLGSLAIELTGDDLEEIDHTMAQIKVVGDRYYHSQ